MGICSEFNLSDLYEGQSFCFDQTVEEAMIDNFAKLTGDVSPLHIDRAFAMQRGFKDRVVHGAILSGLVSRLVGVHLPGKNCLLLSMNMKYPAPTYPNDRVKVTGTVEQLSFFAKAMTIQVTVMNSDSQQILAKGKVIVGFTEEIV